MFFDFQKLIYIMESKRMISRNNNGLKKYCFRFSVFNVWDIFLYFTQFKYTTHGISVFISGSQTNMVILKMFFHVWL